MTIAVIILSVALAGALGVVAWLVYKLGNTTSKDAADLDAARKETRDARADADSKTLEAERAKFDLAKSSATLVDEQKRDQALQEFITNDPIKPNSNLADDDVAGRLRALSGVPDSTNAGGSVPAKSGDEVHHDPVTDVAGSTAVLRS